MRFSLFAAWGVAILEGSRFAELAGADGRVAFGAGGFLFGVLTASHWSRRWDAIQRGDD